MADRDSEGYSVNALDMAKRAYSSPDTPIRTPRGSEYELFARVTRRLKAATSTEGLAFPSLVAALNDNRKLWLVLAEDVSSEGNGLPLPLRHQILELARFTERQTAKVLSGKGALLPLIDINTAIMRGLRSEGSAE